MNTSEVCKLKGWAVVRTTTHPESTYDDVVVAVIQEELAAKDLATQMNDGKAADAPYTYVHRRAVAGVAYWKPDPPADEIDRVLARRVGL